MSVYNKIVRIIKRGEKMKYESISKNFLISLILVLLALPLINADLISINAGGSEEIAITPGGEVENFFVRLSGGGPYQVVLECPDSTTKGSSMSCTIYLEDEGTIAVESTCITWIDLNNNGDKDTGESETSFSEETNPGDNLTKSISLNIPSSTSLGSQVIRTGCSYANSPHPNSTASDTVTITEAVVSGPEGGPSGGGTTAPSITEEDVEEITPVQLFDISFSLEKIILASSDELIAIVMFENFGTEPTEVNLTFIILDEKEVYREEDSVIVETEKFLKKSFKGLNLEEGKYTFVLETLYNVDVKDSFRQDFEIKKKRGITGMAIDWIEGEGKWWLGGIVVVIIIVVLIWRLVIKRRKKKKKTEKKKKKISKKKKSGKKAHKSIYQRIKKEVGNL